MRLKECLDFILVIRLYILEYIASLILQQLSTRLLDLFQVFVSAGYQSY